MAGLPNGMSVTDLAELIPVFAGETEAPDGVLFFDSNSTTFKYKDNTGTVHGADPGAHASTHADGAADAIEATDLGVGTLADGEALTRSGSSLSGVNVNQTVIDKDTSVTRYKLFQQTPPGWADLIADKGAGNEVTVWHCTAMADDGVGVRVTWDDASTTSFGTDPDENMWADTSDGSIHYSTISLPVMVGVRQLEIRGWGSEPFSGYASASA